MAHDHATANGRVRQTGLAIRRIGVTDVSGTSGRGVVTSGESLSRCTFPTAGPPAMAGRHEVGRRREQASEDYSGSRAWLTEIRHGVQCGERRVRALDAGHRCPAVSVTARSQGPRVPSRFGPGRGSGGRVRPLGVGFVPRGCVVVEAKRVVLSRIGLRASVSKRHLVVRYCLIQPGTRYQCRATSAFRLKPDLSTTDPELSN
jgi:hypothetical protein